MATAESEVKRVVAAFAEAWNLHDMVAFSELFAVDAEFVNVVGMWWEGKADIKAAHEHTHSTIFKNSRLTIEKVTVRFPVPQIAIARWQWLLENHVSPDDRPLPPRHGVMVNVLAFQDGQWLIIDPKTRTSLKAFFLARSSAGLEIRHTAGIMTPNNPLRRTVRYAPRR